MFASLPNYIAFFSELDDKKPLNILHEIISKFDQVTLPRLDLCDPADAGDVRGSVHGEDRED